MVACMALDSLGRQMLLPCFVGELGNVDGVPVNGNYSGAALTLTDALSTLAVIGDAYNFERSVNWLIANVRSRPLGFLSVIWHASQHFLCGNYT